MCIVKRNHQEILNQKGSAIVQVIMLAVMVSAGSLAYMTKSKGDAKLKQVKKGRKSIEAFQNMFTRIINQRINCSKLLNDNFKDSSYSQNTSANPSSMSIFTADSTRKFFDVGAEYENFKVTDLSINGISLSNYNSPDATSKFNKQGTVKVSVSYESCGSRAVSVCKPADIKRRDYSLDVEFHAEINGPNIAKDFRCINGEIHHTALSISNSILQKTCSSFGTTSDGTNCKNNNVTTSSCSNGVHFALGGNGELIFACRGNDYIH